MRELLAELEGWQIVKTKAGHAAVKGKVRRPFPGFVEACEWVSRMVGRPVIPPPMPESVAPPVRSAPPPVRTVAPRLRQASTRPLTLATGTIKQSANGYTVEVAGKKITCPSFGAALATLEAASGSPSSTVHGPAGCHIFTRSVPMHTAEASRYRLRQDAKTGLFRVELADTRAIVAFGLSYGQALEWLDNANGTPEHLRHVRTVDGVKLHVT